MQYFALLVPLYTHTAKAQTVLEMCGCLAKVWLYGSTLHSLNKQHNVATMWTEDVAEMEMRYIGSKIYTKCFWSQYDIIYARSHM